MQERVTNAKMRLSEKTALIILVILLGLTCSIYAGTRLFDVVGIVIISQIPVPYDAEVEYTSTGSPDAVGAFQRLVVPRDPDVVQDFYETELNRRGWNVETHNNIFYCLKISRSQVVETYIEISRGKEKSIVYVMSPLRNSICRDNFENDSTRRPR